MNSEDRPHVPTYQIPCPSCAENGRGRVLLVVRVNRKTGHEFMACPEWPECSHTQSVPEAARMIAAGQPMLFDLGDG